MRKDRIENTIRVIKFIQVRPDTYFREISREMGMNLRVLHEIFAIIEPFLIKTPLVAKEANLPNLPIYLKIRPDFTWKKLEQRIAEVDRRKKFKKMIGV